MGGGILLPIYSPYGTKNSFSVIEFIEISAFLLPLFKLRKEFAKHNHKVGDFAEQEIRIYPCFA
jgi:hypothetical protein